MRLRSSLKILGAAIVVSFLLLVPSCRYFETSTIDYVDPAILPQIQSFSYSGTNHAALVLAKSRELRITNDGGLTWQVIPPSAVGDQFETATMVDAQRGFAVSHDEHVFSTNSGGANWTKISELKDLTCGHQLQFLNEREGWLRGCLSIWRTSDGGVTWQKVLSTATPGVAGQPTGMFVFDANSVIASGSGGQFYLTKDGGATWKIAAPIAGDHIDFNDVWFVDRTHGWLAGYQVVVTGEASRPLLLETTDGGDSWQEVSVNSDISPSSVCFIGADGWLAGARRIASGNAVRLEGVLLHTVNGGKSWEHVRLGPEEPFLSDVRFVDKESGWLVGRDSLYRTIDSGKTWTRALSWPPPAKGK